MRNTLAIMITCTTYGSWVRGDRRWWIEEGGELKPPDPSIEHCDRQRMKHPPFRFSPDVQHATGNAIGRALIDRLKIHIHAMTLDDWHLHLVIGATRNPLPNVAKCLKDAARWHLRPDQPIWTDGYDRRFCFTPPQVLYRIRYVESHNLARRLTRAPWPFIIPWSHQSPAPIRPM